MLPLAALGGSEGIHEEISLEQVYIALDTQSRIPLVKRVGKEKIHLDLFRVTGDRALTALEAATQARQLVLLGDAGGGKSTFVRQLAARLAAAELGVRPPLLTWEPLLPLLTTLRDLMQHLSKLQLEGLTAEKRQQRLLTAVQAQWREDCANMGAAELADSLEDWLLDGRVLLIFDGLDEVAEEQRGLVRAAIKAVRDSYSSQLRILVTCRIRSYGGEAVLPGFASETLAPFDEAKINDFVAAWYQAQVNLGRVTPSEAAAKTADLQTAVADEKLLELAQNPMLLTTMAIIHQQDTRLPTERVRLYTRAVDVLLHRWQDRKKIVVSAALTAVLNDPTRLRQLLNRLAYEAHLKQEKEGTGADLSRWDILPLLEKSQFLGNLSLAQEFLDYVDQRAGLLVGHGGQANAGTPPTYSFPHRTFQEYLAGCYMVTGRSPSRMYRQHMGSSDYWYLAAELGSEQLLYNNDQGQTAFLDLAYDLCPAAEPEREADWRGVVWSGRMATLLPQEVIAADNGRPDGGTSYLKRLQPRLQQALRQPALVLRWGERMAAGRSLGQLGDERPGIIDIDHLPLCYVPPGPFWMGSRADDEEAEQDEQPQHEVNLNYGYWLGQYPITQAQYAAFMAAGGYDNPDYWAEAIQVSYWQPGQFQGRGDNEPRQGPDSFGEPFSLPNHPVVGITWYEAVAFGRWLTARWQAAGILPTGWQVRLPSEVEWEKGARGGWQIPAPPILLAAAKIPDWSPQCTLQDNPLPRRLYPWAEAKGEPDRANFAASGLNSSSAVGCFPAGRTLYSCEEMAGNVFEWTRSKYQNYPYAAADGREEFKSDDDAFVIRGGYYGSDASWLRCAFRPRYHPNDSYSHLGFRIVVLPIFP